MPTINSPAWLGKTPRSIRQDECVPHTSVPAHNNAIVNALQSLLDAQDVSTSRTSKHTQRNVASGGSLELMSSERMKRGCCVLWSSSVFASF